MRERVQEALSAGYSPSNLLRLRPFQNRPCRKPHGTCSASRSSFHSPFAQHRDPPFRRHSFMLHPRSGQHSLYRRPELGGLYICHHTFTLPRHSPAYDGTRWSCFRFSEYGRSRARPSPLAWTQYQCTISPLHPFQAPSAGTSQTHTSGGQRSRSAGVLV